ncbi:MAG: efflux RND transporter periplasmic adaptor subunit [Bacteroidales bacterium]|nr:efflux RND transporter periplasmic adaptor subunit [Bacteroidales bacterium]
MNWKKLWIWLLIITALLIILAIIGPKIGIISPKNIYEVTTAKATRKDITEIITASGKIQPEVEVKISSDVSGEIVELLVKEGDEVKKGQLLAKIKPDVYLSSLQRMEASLESAKANLGNAKARLAQIEAQFMQTELTYQRNKKLYEQGTISQAEYDNSFSAYKMAKAEVEAARQSVLAAEYTVKSTEASLNEANANLVRTNIYAPMSGTVSKLNVKLGERVVGTMQMAGTEMMRIADLNAMEAVVTVNENDIVRIHIGDTATIEVDAYTNDIFKGIVTSVANSSTNTTSSISSTVSTDQVATYEVKIKILPESYAHLIKSIGSPYPFRPGMSATVDIRTKNEKNVIAVPLQAVTTRPDTILLSLKIPFDHNKKKKVIECVFRISPNETIELIPVETGIQNDEWIHIIKGINENDEVVTGPFNLLSKKLKHGDRIKKIEPFKKATPIDQP